MASFFSAWRLRRQNHDRNMEENPQMTFTPAHASWTKKQIAEEVNEYDFGDFITEDMISDGDANEFVNSYCDWLLNFICRSEEEALDAEAQWEEQWYIKVMSKWFLEHPDGVQV